MELWPRLEGYETSDVSGFNMATSVREFRVVFRGLGGKRDQFFCGLVVVNMP